MKFTITGGELPAAGTEVTTGADGRPASTGYAGSAAPGDYTVTETVPAGYVSDDAEKTVTVSDRVDLSETTTRRPSASTTHR